MGIGEEAHRRRGTEEPEDYGCGFLSRLKVRSIGDADGCNDIPRLVADETLGTLTSSLVHSRETFRAAIIGGAASIVVSHNHRSGDSRPSSADLSVTRSLREASQILGIDLVDHGKKESAGAP